MNDPLTKYYHLADKIGSDALQDLLARLSVCEARLRHLLESFHDAVLLYNPETGKIIDCNLAAGEMLKRTREQLLASRFDECVQYSPHVTNAGVVGDASFMLAYITAPGGEADTRQASILQTPLRAGQEPLVQAILTPYNECDERLSEAERRPRDLRHKTKRLEEADRMRAEFLALISHELRTPLNAIIGYNSLLEERIYGELTSQQEKAVRRIDRNAARLLALINQLLELSRLEAGAAIAFEESFDLRKAVGEVLDEYQVIAEEKGLEILVSQPRREIQVYTDASKVQEIVRQIVSNALKFAHQGSLTVSMMPKNEAAVLEIADEGPGFAAEQRKALFQLFQQGGPAMMKRPEGAGLGLAIVRRLCDLLKLETALESEPGRGAVFRLYIPLAPSGETSIAITPDSDVNARQVEPQESEAGNGGAPPIPESALPSILVVDDDPYAVEILADFLETRGHYRVAKAYSGMHAMLQLAKSRPDYLLADLLMPTINGERLIEYCRQLWGDQVKVIVVTGKILTQEERERLEQRVVAIIFKGELRTGGFLSSLERVLPIPAAPPHVAG